MDAVREKINKFEKLLNDASFKHSSTPVIYSIGLILSLAWQLECSIGTEKVCKSIDGYIHVVEKEITRPPMTEADWARVEARWAKVEARMYPNDSIEGKELDRAQEHIREVKRGGGGPDDETRQAIFDNEQMTTCDRADF